MCVSGVRMGGGGAPRCCASFRLGRPAADGIADAIESDRARDRKGPHANFARRGEGAKAALGEQKDNCTLDDGPTREKSALKAWGGGAAAGALFLKRGWPACRRAARE